MTHEEVLSQLRLHGLTDIGQVQQAYLEPNGMISIIPVRGRRADDPPAAPTS